MGDRFGNVVEMEDEDDEFVFDDDELTWRMVSEAAGVEEPERNLRSNSTAPSSSKKKKAVASSSGQVLGLVDEEEEVNADFEDIEQEYVGDDDDDDDDDDEDEDEALEDDFDDELCF